jgi:hypothetical protein
VEAVPEKPQEFRVGQPLDVAMTQPKPIGEAKR